MLELLCNIGEFKTEYGFLLHTFETCSKTDTKYTWKLLHLSDFVNNFKILQLFLALERNIRQNTYLRFCSLWLSSFKKRLQIKNY